VGRAAEVDGVAAAAQLRRALHHYGSTKALLNAAVLAAMEEFGEEMAKAIGAPDPALGALGRFEQFWTRVIESFQASTQVWQATFDIFTVAQRDPVIDPERAPSPAQLALGLQAIADQVIPGQRSSAWPR